MFISHRYHVIFVHIQRTGGNSIRKLLNQEDPDLINKIALDSTQLRIKHCFASDIRQAIDPDCFNRYTKFCVVRNPFDRMISWYAMFKHQTTEKVPQHQFPDLWQLGEQSGIEIAKHTDSFETFLAMPEEAEHGFFKRFYYNQLDYLTDHEGKLLVDKVLRFENLEEDFRSLAKAIGIKAPLPHVNQSVREDYRRHYTPETRMEVERRFQRDINYFEYSF